MYRRLQNIKSAGLSFKLRLALLAMLGLAAGAALALVVPASYSATPTSGSISEANPITSWSGQIKPATGSADCGGPSNSGCENFNLTIQAPSAAYGPYLVEVRLQPALLGDWDMQVYGPAGNLLDGSGNSPGQTELVVLLNPPSGTYTVSAAPFAPMVNTDTSSFTATAELKHHVVIAANNGTDTNISYHNFAASGTLGTGAGEPTVGVNWKTNRAMFISGTQTLRVTFDDSTVPARATWEDKSFLGTDLITMDPILFTDPKTGRTIVSQLITPAAANGLAVLTDGCSLSAFTDDDGDTWVQNQGCGLPSGADHQSIGGGPFHSPLPSELPLPAQANGYTHATYYCAQSGVTAYCSRSDDGGLTYGPGVPIYTTECGGLHGHPMVGPDGTVYVPNKNCGGRQGVAVSENNGLTWSVRTVPNTLGSSVDPGVAIDAKDNVYLGYQNGDGRPSIAVSTNHGVDWTPSVDVGGTYGIKNTVFPRVVAGDDGRAAFAFLGTPTGGPFQDATFQGEWHLYIASTFNRGQSWTTIDATPTDPVQRGCIWMQGGSNPCRNLLDFMGAAVDNKGRVLVGYADGCINCSSPGGSRSKKATIARQVNGRRMFAEFDPQSDPSPTPTPSPTATPTPAPSGPVVLHFHGNPTDDNSCTGSGTADILACDGPMLLEKSTLGTGPAAHWDVPDVVHNGTADRNIYDPNWIWQLSEPTTLKGDMALQWWATCVDCGPTGTADWNIRLWADGVKAFEKRVTFTPPVPNIPTLLYTTVTLPQISASSNFVLHIDPVNPATQTNTRIQYDSDTPCAGNTSGQPCDSKVTMPVFRADGNPTPTPTPAPSPTPTPNPSPTPTPTPGGNACLTGTEVTNDPEGDQVDPVLPQPGATQLDIHSLVAGEDYRFINSARLAFKVKVDNLNSIPKGSVWRVLFDFTPPGGTLTTYYVAMTSDGNSAISYDYGTQSGNLLTSLGGLEEGSYSSDGTITMTLSMTKVGAATGKVTAGSTIANLGAQTEQATDLVAGTLFSTVDDTTKVSYTVNAKSAACTPVDPPLPPGTATYIKGGITFSPNMALRASVASRDGEPSMRVDKFGNAYVAGIRGVPAGVDLWYFDLRPGSSTYDPLMRNPIYRGQPDQFSPDESMEVGADGGGDVDLAVGFDEATPGAPPYLAFSSLTAANISSARSTDRGATFTKNPAGNVTGGVPADDRQWMEFYGKDSVYLLYRTLSPVVAYVQRSNDGGLTYGPAHPVGTIGQVGGITVDQNDGTVYVSGASGMVAVGVPSVAGLEPLTYTTHEVVPAGNAHIFFIVKAGSDGTVYACYSDGKNINIKYSKDKGVNWSAPIRVSDGPDTRTSVLPALATGPTPGSIGVAWYGTSETSNNDNANWKVFFAQSLNATSAVPTFRQVELSDHFIHGSNISESGLPLIPGPSPNRNLLDYFQIGFDPTGAAVVAYTDDHNDFDGHTYVARQTSGPGIGGANIPAPVQGSAVPAPTPYSTDGSQVVDFRHDVRTQVAALDVDDPLDILSVKYSTEGTSAAPLLVATMKVSGLTVAPPSATWRMNFAANVPYAQISPTGDYNFGISDRGDQFFLRAATDATGAATYVYGTAVRAHQMAGAITYTDLGAADAGSIDTATGTITVKVAISKLNAALPAGHAPIGVDSVLAGLRASTFITAQGQTARSDSTRGGTQYVVNTPPSAGLQSNSTSGLLPLNIGFNASTSGDLDPGQGIASYVFDFGDGSVVTQSSPTVTHTYTKAGIYNATLKVIDTRGGVSGNTARITITVLAVPKL